MSGDDNFIARWSRLKREAESRKPEAEPSRRPSVEARAEQPAPEAAQPAVVGSGEARAAAEPPFDAASLPPIDSIVAGSDIRAFLQKGVPAELTKAALRRAWTTDPAIRDFIGLAENQWDFTDPTAIPGFGPLEASSEMRDLVAQAMGRLAEAPETVGAAEESRPQVSEMAEQRRSPVAGTEAIPAPPERADDQNAIEVAASQHPEPASDSGTAPRRKGHGAALPR